MGLSQAQAHIIAISVQGQRCRETGGGRGVECVRASFSKACVPFFPRSCGVTSVCARVLVAVQFEGHPVWAFSPALSHPHTSLPFLPDRPSGSIFTSWNRFPAANKLEYANFIPRCRVLLNTGQIVFRNFNEWRMLPAEQNEAGGGKNSWIFLFLFLRYSFQQRNSQILFLTAKLCWLVLCYRRKFAVNGLVKLSRKTYK